MISNTRARTGALSALLLAGLLALTSCSAQSDAGGNDATHGDDAAGALVPEAEGRTGYPLTLDTPWGSTELPERPMRIAAVTPSQDDVEILAAIGVTPIIANESAADAWVEQALPQPIPQRFSNANSQFPVEQIAKADPDLIITLGSDLSQDFEQLAAIAPVLSTAEPGGSEQSNANDWQRSILRVGEVLDLTQAAERALEQEESYFADFRAEHPEFAGLTANYVVYYGASGGLQLHSTEHSPAGSVLERMGFELSPAATELDYRADISPEMISAIDADVLLFSENSDGNASDITDLPLFRALGAVKSGHLIMIDNRSTEGVFVIDGTEYGGNLPWALARSGPLSSVWAAQQIAPALADSVAG